MNDRALRILDDICFDAKAASEREQSTRYVYQDGEFTFQHTLSFHEVKAKKVVAVYDSGRLLKLVAAE